MGCATGSALAGATVATGEPLLRAPLPAAESTSDFVIRPAGPLPANPARSTPSAAAARAATGETLTFSGAAPAGTAAAPAAPRGALAGVATPSPAPTEIRAITCPTVTVSPSP